VEVFDEYNLINLSKGVMRALGKIAPLTSPLLDFEDLQAKVAGLLDLIWVVDEDHQKAGRFLMGKLRYIPLQAGPRGGDLGTVGGAPLTLAMTIVDDTGAEAGTLGQLLQGLKTLTSKNALLRERLESLSAENSMQGGVILDSLGLTLEAQALEAVLAECPDGDAF
jgi:hypothetical protein